MKWVLTAVSKKKKLKSWETSSKTSRTWCWWSSNSSSSPRSTHSLFVDSRTSLPQGQACSQMRSGNSQSTSTQCRQPCLLNRRKNSQPSSNSRTLTTKTTARSLNLPVKLITRRTMTAWMKRIVLSTPLWSRIIRCLAATQSQKALLHSVSTMCLTRTMWACKKPWSSSPSPTKVISRRDSIWTVSSQKMRLILQ